MIDIEFLENILDFANMYVWVLRYRPEKGDYIYEYVSRGIEKFIGTDRDTLLGKPSNWIDYVYPDDRNILTETLTILLKEKEVHEVYRVIGEDGRIKWVESVVYPICSKPGVLSGIKGYTIDITEKKEKEEKIAKGNKYLTILSRLGLLFLEGKHTDDIAKKLLNMLGEVIDADRAYWIEERENKESKYITQRAGWVKRDKGIRIDPLYFTRYSDEKGFPEIRKILFRGNIYMRKVDHIEDHIFRKALEKEGVKAIFLSPIYVDKKYLGFLGFESMREEQIWKEEEFSLLKTSSEMFGNFLLRKKREEELHSLTLQFETLMASMPILVAFRDREGRWVYANPLAEEYLGLKGKDYKGKTTEELILLSESKEFETVFKTGSKFDKEVLKKRKRIDYILNYTKDGREIFLHVKKTPIFDEHGELEGILVIGIDITNVKKKERERQRMQERMMEAQKLESLGLMASNIAHDFNNILTAISGNISLICAVCEAPEKIEKYVKRLTDAVDRAKALINNMFLYTGHTVTSKKILSLGEEIKKIYGFIEAILPKNIEVVIEDPKEDIHLYFDPSQLQQIVMNLIINAKDAIEKEEGKILIRTEKVELKEEDIEKLSHPMEMKPGIYALIEIGDNGPGIPREVLKNIFDPFFSTKPTGKGLGLSILFGIVKSSEGGINLITEEGKGTVFQIFLPIHNSRPEESVSGEISPKEKKGKRELRILVVDDEKWVRDMLLDVLSLLGYVPYGVSSGVEALSEIEKDPEAFDIVILDYSMPKMNGVETLKKIREIAPDLPVILSSGYTDMEVLKKVEKLRGVFIHKPYKMEALEELIKNLS